MRMIFSIIGFALFVVGCNSLVPLKDRVLELPTQKYQKPDERLVREELGNHQTGDSRTLAAITESCRKFGRFIVKGDGVYTCYPEGK